MIFYTIKIKKIIFTHNQFFFKNYRRLKILFLDFMTNKITVLLFFLLINNYTLKSQCLILGADLSYVNTIEKNGGVYHDENGSDIDPYMYFAERGANMVRMRLWHTPENNTDVCGQPITSNNLQDVVTGFKRAKTAGMKLNLAIHYGDYFNDPSKQKMPAAWIGLPNDILIDSIYQYTYAVLNTLYSENTIPDIVAVGNETTWGFIDATETTNGWEWPLDAQKFNAGFNAIDAFNIDHNSSIKKAVHFTDKTAAWLAGLFKDNGINNFDIIGLSFYPAWTDFNSVAAFGELIKDLKNNYTKEIMVLETGAAWSTGYADNYNNIMNNFGNLNYPISPQGQKDFLLDLTQTVYANGGTGVLYWEPAYITSQMCTKWGQGSPYENVCFFDFNNNNEPLPAFDFFNFCETINSAKEEKELGVLIFPNPNNNTDIHIESPTILSSWQLLDLTGKTLENGIFNQGNNGYLINLKEKFKGIYLLKITTEDNKVLSKKIEFNTY